MKVNMNGTVRPTKLDDKVLNKTLGQVIARLSPDAVQAIVLRHAEIEVAIKVRQRWLAQIKSVADSSASNVAYSSGISTAPAWASVADEALAYIRDDQDQLDKEDLLARGHILLCDKVISALAEASGDAPVGPAVHLGDAPGGSHCGFCLQPLPSGRTGG